MKTCVVDIRLFVSQDAEVANISADVAAFLKEAGNLTALTGNPNTAVLRIDVEETSSEDEPE